MMTSLARMRANIIVSLLLSIGLVGCAREANAEDDAQSKVEPHPAARITVRWEGASPEELHREVGSELGSSLRSLPHLESLTAISTWNETIIYLEAIPREAEVDSSEPIKHWRWRRGTGIELTVSPAQFDRAALKRIANLQDELPDNAVVHRFEFLPNFR